MFEKRGKAQTHRWVLEPTSYDLNVTNPLQNRKRGRAPGPQRPADEPVNSARSATLVTLTANY
jgi:hypothetical protein